MPIIRKRRKYVGSWRKKQDKLWKIMILLFVRPRQLLLTKSVKSPIRSLPFSEIFLRCRLILQVFRGSHFPYFKQNPAYRSVCNLWREDGRKKNYLPFRI